MKTKQSGFTLIEMIVVIFIISLLAAVAIPKFLSITLKAEAATVKNILGSTRSALSLRLASEIVKGTSLDTLVSDGSAAIEPMADLLGERPEDYIGATTTEPTEANKGQWQDLTLTPTGGGSDSTSLVYTLINDNIIEAVDSLTAGVGGGWTTTGLKNIRQYITLVHLDETDPTSPAAGLSLAPTIAERFDWAKLN